jgi:hypothetical protein
VIFVAPEKQQRPLRRVGSVERNKGKRNHGLPKGVTRRPNSSKLECKVHMDGKRFYVGLFNSVQEALDAQAMRRLEIIEAARLNPQRYENFAGRTLTGDEEIQKVRRAQAEGAPIEKVWCRAAHFAQADVVGSHPNKPQQIVLKSH